MRRDRHLGASETARSSQFLEILGLLAEKLVVKHIDLLFVLSGCPNQSSWPLNPRRSGNGKRDALASLCLAVIWQ